MKYNKISQYILRYDIIAEFYKPRGKRIGKEIKLRVETLSTLIKNEFRIYYSPLSATNTHV